MVHIIWGFALFSVVIAFLAYDVRRCKKARKQNLEYRLDVLDKGYEWGQHGSDGAYREYRQIMIDLG